MDLVLVLKKDEIKIWKLLYGSDSYIMFYKGFDYFRFNIDDVVCILSIKRIFEREYDNRWSVELFIIVSRCVKENIFKYVLKDFNNELIMGEFYE